ncbi:stage II sporulation protein P [Clostridium bowmanii]|uniref:stage II sporulation protein P n=1 Tax=Clostridium bowmanii TaxID=132925 RepID=UPI001C0D9854|nr:stage II sporulation protein P [Clostridium bowmanii]MBU3189715.1 stage II sporulation protein P [Clostridium bowmanii]MCA1074197.1 stage II sporulation protein P [Clostridium bowmanii]
MSYSGIDFKGVSNKLTSEKPNFPKHNCKKDTNGRVFSSIFTLLIIFLFGSILPKSVRAYGEGKYQNYFYVKAISNTLSVINVSKTEEKNTDNETSIKFAVLSILGVDILNPISIIAKEISYLNNNEIIPDSNVNNHSSGVENLKTFILHPFNLGEKQVSKNEATIQSSNLVSTLYNPTLKKTLNNARPEVLIYHSHTSEAYLVSDKDTTKVDSSSDATRNVTAVGDVIEEELEKNYGIAVIHDKTVNDKGDYYSAYKKSGVTLDKYLKQYGDFKLIIDLHRDSVKAATTKLNGENVAPFMFVVTEKNPRYAKQRKVIDSMIGTSNKLFPGLLYPREIYTYQYGMGFYNQNRSDNAVLIEVGSDNNTIEQAKNTGKYLARIIAEQLNGKK